MDHLLTFAFQIANPSVAELYEDALVYETGSAITASGALSAYSGAKTGRSPSDKRIVQEASSDKEVWWGPVNKPMSQDVGRSSFVINSSVFSPQQSFHHTITFVRRQL
jgi:ATP-dependent phosphoenolpyruvate carboxykinase